MKKHKFSICKKLKSFTYAFHGLRILLQEEHNARIHVFVALCVVVAGFIFNISTMEWVAVLLSIGLVISLETINSSIEHIADFISPDKHKKIKAIKDLAAAGVLISAITALIIGLLIFIPKILVLC